MRTLFGVRIETLALVLSGVVIVAVLLVGALALRDRVFFRLGVRNIGRRVGRSVLIVVGLMLATTIIAAALGTGDTMGYNVRNNVVRMLGSGDEWVTVRGAKPNINVPLALTPGLAPFPVAAPRAAIEQWAARTGRVDAVVPAVVRPVAVQDLASRQTEPFVTLFGPEAAGAAKILSSADDQPVRLDRLGPDEVVLGSRAADELGARVGDRLRVFTGARMIDATVAAVADVRGAGSPRSVMVVPIDRARAWFEIPPGQADALIVSNRGGGVNGAVESGSVVAGLRDVLARDGLAVHPLKRDGLDAADQAGAAFMQMFSTFGSFSIAAGILLIFLIFVMLAAERRTEMGVARAIGMQRGHLVESFVFEGAVYDLVAAAIGAALGVAVSYVMVLGIAHAFAAQQVDLTFSLRWESVVVAYALGVALTFVVVSFSAWRVSVLNIVTAVRNLPDPGRAGRTDRGLARAAVLVVLGALLILSGRSSAQTMPFMLGISLVLVGLVPVARRLGVPDRPAYTVAGVGIVVTWLLPFRVVDALVPGASSDFSMWIVGGLMIVLGATWTVIYNADALLGAAMAVFGRIRGLAAVLRVSMAYPLRSRLRTGMTLSMFTLVVFTLVVGITTPLSFMASLAKVETYGGGYQVRATTPPVASTGNFGAEMRNALGPRADAVRAVAGISNTAVRARANDTQQFTDYPVRGVDATFRRTNRFPLGSRARGYSSDAAVWRALGRDGDLAVVDPWIVPHRRNWNFGAITKLELAGVYAEDPTFSPVPVEIRDPRSGAVRRLRVIGILRDSMPLDLAGIMISAESAQARFGERAVSTLHLLRLAPGSDPKAFARALESRMLDRGVQADSFQKLVDDARNGSLVFLRLIEGFMGLGLGVGVAALGVIAARSVVERRQQIGVLRAIGFQASAVRLGFLLESGFLALTAIVVGSGLGLAMAYNVIDDAQRQASWSSVQLIVPWANLLVVFAAVLVIALATTYLPARRASKIYAAEALRYQ